MDEIDVKALTTQNIVDLYDEAGAAGDLEMVAICEAVFDTRNPYEVMAAMQRQVF